MRLRPDKSYPEFCIFPGICIYLFENPGEVQGITRNYMDHRRFEIAHQLYLSLTVARPCRYYQGPYFFGGIVKPETTREKAV